MCLFLKASCISCAIYLGTFKFELKREMGQQTTQRQHNSIGRNSGHSDRQTDGKRLLMGRSSWDLSSGHKFTAKACRVGVRKGLRILQLVMCVQCVRAQVTPHKHNTRTGRCANNLSTLPRALSSALTFSTCTKHVLDWVRVVTVCVSGALWHCAMHLALMLWTVLRIFGCNDKYSWLSE